MRGLKYERGSHIRSEMIDLIRAWSEYACAEMRQVTGFMSTKGSLKTAKFGTFNPNRVPR